MTQNHRKIPVFLTQKEVEILTKNVRWDRHKLGFFMQKQTAYYTKKIESRIDSLKMCQASGSDVDILMKIEKLEKGFEVGYELYLYNIL